MGKSAAETTLVIHLGVFRDSQFLPNLDQKFFDFFLLPLE